MKRHEKIAFKEYEMNQPMLLPQSLDELIPQGHLVRLVNSVIESMDIKPLLKTYKGGGTSSYHPKMLLKVIVYAYSQKIYSSRRIAKALHENIHMMWISGKSSPDFRTINRFRSSRLKKILDDVFAYVLEVLVKNNLVSLEEYFLDGTKLEANAGRYTYTWSKSTSRHKSNLQKKIRDLLGHIDAANERENEKYGDRDLEENGEECDLSSEDIEKIAAELDERLKANPEDKDTEKTAKKLKKDILPKLKQYEKYESIANGRNSFSKTDHDATFMRLKDDHLQNGQLRAAYNIQTGTENQFVTCYSIHQNAGDSVFLKENLEQFQKLHNILPKAVIADAGYGSEENYLYLENEGIEHYVKYNYFHKEQTAAFKKKIFDVKNIPYNEESDEYICPDGKMLKYFDDEYTKTKTGYVVKSRVYQCDDCSSCQFRSECISARALPTSNRKVRRSPLLELFKKRARENLQSEKGLEYRSRRPIEVETVFGQIKENRGFRRFMLRGLEKVRIEWGLLCLAHNLTKMHTMTEMGG